MAEDVHALWYLYSHHDHCGDDDDDDNSDCFGLFQKLFQQLPAASTTSAVQQARLRRLLLCLI